MRYLKFGLLFIFVMGVLIALSAQAPPKVNQSQPALQSVPPPTDWLNKYDELMALQRVIQKIRAENGLDKLESQLNSNAQELQKGIPTGYTFNAQTKMFDKVPDPPTPAVKPETKK